MVGTRVLHYQIQKKLGEGGMGIVYLARDTRLERDVAIKFLPRQISANDNELERFKVEAQAAAALNHPNITQIYAIEEHEDPQRGKEYFIVMEFVSGKELQQVLAGKTLHIDEVIDFALQIGAGLKAAHEAGVIHRDIKSANIMITADDRVKIMDFSLAKKQGGPQMTVQGTSMGTIAYMSPEQTEGSNIDHRTDIWAFGVVLYEMLTGELPFKGSYEQAIIYSILNEQAPVIQDIRHDAPLALQEVVAKCMAKDADQRFQNMSNVLHHLKSARGLPGGESVPVAKVNHEHKKEEGATREPAHRTKLVFTAVAVTIIAIVTGIFIFTGNDHQAAPAQDQIVEQTAVTDQISPVIQNLMRLEQTEEFLRLINEYKDNMQIAVGKKSDFEPADGCFVFVIDKEKVMDAFRYSENQFTSLASKRKLASLSDLYSGKTQIWLRDLSN